MKADQAQLYELLARKNRCFVRICGSDDALWVSDLPRKTSDLSDAETTLWQNGFACHVDNRARLLYVDWTESKWKETLSQYPAQLPCLPQDERLHAAFALCRLWLSHPSPITPDTLPAVRRVLKLTLQPEEKMLHSVAVLHEEAAVQLRTGHPVAHAAGLILAGWLNERSQTS